MQSKGLNSIFYTGHVSGNRILNPYQVYEENGKKYVSMQIQEHSEKIKCVDFDYEDLPKLTYKKNSKKHISWNIVNGYVGGRTEHGQECQIYMHHVILDFTPDGKGTGSNTSDKLSVDHIDRNPLNNRRSNLRLVDHKTQQENKKGSLEGTKRKVNSNRLNAYPSHIDQQSLPKYVNYRFAYEGEVLSRRFFVIGSHPLQKLKMAPKEVKSTQGLELPIGMTEAQYDKLKFDEIMIKLKDLDEKYEKYLKDEKEKLINQCQEDK